MPGKNEADEKYNILKEFKGSRYTGIKVGSGHKWNYDQGEWRERKVKPDEWDVYYETTKRRAGFAPEGSGAPVGTEYNWLIIAHQRVKKLDANSYSTCLEGKKFKVAHKRSGKNDWNIKEKSQRKKVINFLKQIVDELKKADEKGGVIFTVGERERIYGLEHKTKKELYDIAMSWDLPNRSRMRRAELLSAIKSNLEEEKQKTQDNRNQTLKLERKSREELYEIARKKRLKGRGEMKKEELVEALKGMSEYA